ncbi:hypothetical protein COO60DRAFT_1457262 [Scenedesmus sp. NREL 46B-D3]|nr:hypothetical protein COO60DRAFT_1457262 [Scenedesmus sp. NREL 46B-D3]
MPPRGKHLGVQEGSLLQLLRSAGFKAELPPSTVAWLENAPVFRFISGKISQENFVAPGDQQEYSELMMAKGPNADLYDALGSGSDDEMDDGQQQDQQGKDQQWMGAASDADMQRQVQAKEQYVQHLEQQVTTLKALSSQLDASTRKQRSRQPLYIRLQAHANHELAAATAELEKLSADLNSLLQGLRDVCSSLASLASERPEQWLLCAADLGSYGEQDEAARQLFNRYAAANLLRALMCLVQAQLLLLMMRLKGQLAAAGDVESSAGGFALLKKMGPPCVVQLLHDVSELEEARQLLGSQQLTALTEDLARLNDTYIVAGDYDRQLHKMALAAQRKQAVLLKLLDVTSRHLLLLMMGSQEWSRLDWLSQELQAAHAQLNGHVERVKARMNRCAAGVHALQQAQQRSNLQADDVYLQALAAAAGGSLSMQPTPTEAGCSTAAAEPGTPFSSLAAALASTPRRPKHTMSAGSLMPACCICLVAEAQQQLEGCCQALGRDMHRLVMRQNEYAVMLNQQRGELELERSVMRLFFTQPAELAAHVARLKGEVEALELAHCQVFSWCTGAC